MRERILPGDPIGNFLAGAHILFEPAIGIGDLFAEYLFNQIVAARFGIGW